MTTWAVRLCLAACLALAPLDAIAKTAPAQAHAASDLGGRVADAIARYQGGSNRPSLDELKGLVAELSATGGYDSGLWQVYAYSLARAKQFDDAIAIADDLIRRLEADGHGESRDMGDTLLARAAFLDLKGDGDGALATKYKAQAIFAKSDGPDSGRANVVKAQIAFSLLGRGRLGEALQAYGEALPVLENDPDSVRVYAVQMSNYANGLRLQGDLAGALEASRKAVAVSQAKLPPDHPAILFALNNLGSTLMELGRYGEAESVLRQGLDLARQQGGKQNVDTLGMMYRLGQVLARQGHDDEADSLFTAALDGLPGVPLGANGDLPGLIRLECADIALERGDRTGAAADLRAGLDAIATTGAMGDLTRSRLQTRLAEVMVLDGDLDAATAQLAPALDFYGHNLPEAAPDRVRAAMLDALIRARQGQADAYDRAMAVDAAMRTYLDTYAVLRSEPAELIAVYRLSFHRFAEIALVTGHPDSAFMAAQWAAQSELAVTSQALAVRAAAANPQAADLIVRLQMDQTRRLRLDRERNFARSRAPAEVMRLDDQIAALDRDLSDLGGRLDTAFPDFRRLSQPHPRSIAEAQTGLARDQAIIMPVLADDRLLTLVVTRDGLTWDSAPLDRPTAERDIAALRVAIAGTLRASDGNSAFPRATAWQLGQAVFTPKIQAALKHRHDLTVLGSGPLMSLPFSLLLLAPPEGSDSDPRSLRDSAWLIKRFAVSVKPALLATEPATARPSGFLGVGAPTLGPAGDSLTTLDSGTLYRANSYRDGPDRDARADVEALRRLPSLPHAAEELDRMNVALDLPGSRLITGNDATETRIKTTDLSSYGVIAFATHGLISGNLATLREPALVLTPPAEPTADDDGLLTASDVAGLHLKAQWVILSACNTGSGREAGAAGYSGLARAFMQAGSESLLVSLWPVRDDVADRLSVDTVRRHARGASQAEALRQATLAVMRDPSVPGGANPAIWAPFSLVVR